MAIPPWLAYPESQPNHQKRAVIIGAGLAGCSVATALARRDWDVTLVERHPALSMEASGNPGGVVMPTLSRDNTPGSQFSQEAFAYALQHFQQLKAITGSHFFHSTSVMQLTQHAAQLKAAIDLSDTALPAYLLTAAQAATVSGIDTSLSGTNNSFEDTVALHYPTAGWVNPNTLCSAQINAQHPRIKVLLNRKVVQLRRNPSTWSIIDEHGELTDAPVVVLANGTTANQFQQTTPIELVPVRGQISYIAAHAFPTPIKMVVCSRQGHLIPDKPGTVIVGASYERTTLHTQVTQQGHHDNLHRLHTLCPLAQCPLTRHDEAIVTGGRAAIRVGTPDRLPLLGGIPDFPAYRETYNDLHHGRAAKNYPLPCYHPGLFIAAGFGSHGITHCPYTGELLSMLINGETNSTDRERLALLHPGRFLARKLRKTQ